MDDLIDLIPEPMAYHRCPVCKKPMLREMDDHYGPGWVFDCDCLDAPSQPDGEAK
jgi:hypothetical protein